MDNKLGLSANYLVKIQQLLINDEVFMRLLKYAPEGMNGRTYVPDPLDESLPNVVNPQSDEYWKLVEERVRQGNKRSDINDTELCIVYIYHGRKRRIFDNRTLVKQEVKIDIYIHETFEIDNRMDRLSDRLSYLLMGETGVAGIGRMDYVGSNPREAPIGYRKQEEIYVYSTGSKRYK